MRGAAMSLPAAASGLVVLLLTVPVIQGQDDWGVTYSSTEICAFKGSTVDMSCTYRYPSTVQRVENRFWFTKVSNGVFTDLRTDPEYSGRVQHICGNNDCRLRIRDLRESDSAEYKFRFITDQEGGRYTGEPGVTLTVTYLQVKVSGSSHSSWRELKCHSSCRLPDRSSYIWYRNGQKIPSQTSSTYSNYFNYADSFSCAVEGHEDFPSPPVCVYDRPCYRVIYTDRSICASKGSSVDISCTYSSYDTIRSKFWFSPERSHQWQSPSQPEDLSDSQFAGRVQVLESERGRSTLRITDLTESDSAQYHFTFKTGWSEWRSSLPGTTLTVTALQVQVTRITVHQSDTEAELKCHSSCSPAARLSYVWFKNGQKVTGVETSSFKGRVYPGDIISCALKGHENYGSPPVYAPRLPSVSVSPSAEIVEGSSVTLTCSSDANPAANYTWYRENYKLLQSPEGSYYLTSISSEDRGNYSCKAQNQHGQTSSSVFIDVQYAPRLPSVSVSPSAEIVEGSSVTLTCSSDANPAANYTWYKENQTLIQGPEGFYHFSSISSEDRGNYSCKSENQYGEIMSSSVSVDVQYGPRLPSVSVSPSAEIVEGSSVTLTCSSDANPAASYTWYKENEDSPKASEQIFTITDIRAEHSGNYSCEVQNRRGRHNSTLQLTVSPRLWKSAVIKTTPVVILAIIGLALFVLIRKSRAAKQSPQRGDEPDNRTQEQDDLQYASVLFSTSQTDPVYSNIRPAGHHRHEEGEEEEGVEYAAVRFTRAGAAPRSRGPETVEDPSGLYSTVNKQNR
ncbi:B-cell receptor CD22-like isoform X2 [Acanthopagrus latus]|uniref:B-cell receptor CD22-like isoform X2 n=1 Tax=Acanthopagrus latus TaxID=8177 RepID=UPI00187C0E29|nr:B-cell receptor CD22-like isoform X2 [Acanthopagrus latus]